MGPGPKLNYEVWEPNQGEIKGAGPALGGSVEQAITCIGIVVKK